MRSFHRIYHFFSLVTLVFAFGVVVLGAYVRLTDAGLGCPDWPVCFGELFAPLTDAEQQAASKAFPGVEVDATKAWREMVHRYAAAILGILILILALLSFFQGARTVGAVITSWLLVAAVIFQAWLGKLTVDYLLQPQIVVGHLMGGLMILALLRWLTLQVNPDVAQPSGLIGGWRWLATIGVLVLAGQLFLGGWTSANYAAYGCPDFPLCQGELIPKADFKTAFDFSQTDVLG
ncbi:MAG: COX15/CtaA family protein [Gammaproteobacteria bacterium]|nr:COX15/CtaA family protein [Gammaproteobacteria bacterium]